MSGRRETVNAAAGSQLYTRFTDMGWLHRPELFDHWWAAGRDPSAGLAFGFDEFCCAMRNLMPVPWFHRGIREVPLMLDQGQCVTRHKHPDVWTLIYYVEVGLADPLYVYEPEPSELVHVIDVEPDSAVLLPPGVEHEVKPVHALRRYSIAFRAWEHDDRRRWDV